MSSKELSFRKSEKRLYQAFGILKESGWLPDEDGLLKGCKRGQRTSTRKVYFEKNDEGISLQMSCLFLCRRRFDDRVVIMTTKLSKEWSPFVSSGFYFDFYEVARGRRIREGVVVGRHLVVQNLEEWQPRELARMIEVEIDLVSWISRELVVCSDRLSH